MRARWILLIVVCVGIAAGGLAYAAIPNSAGVINGCYQKVSGQLRVIDTSAGKSCTPSETALNWNQTGPQGQPGATGARGPSDVWFDSRSFPVTLTPYTTANDTAIVTSIQVPAGNFVLFANVEGFDSTGGTAWVQCFLDSDTSGTTVDDAAWDQSVAVGQFESFPLKGTATVTTGPATIHIQCQEVGGVAGLKVAAGIMAIQVATIH